MPHNGSDGAQNDSPGSTIGEAAHPLHARRMEFVGFEPTYDGPLLQRVYELARPSFPAMVKAFYDRIERFPALMAIIEEHSSRERQANELRQWLETTLQGPWDDAYFEKRHRIGVTHVRIGLPAPDAIASMDVVRRGLKQAVAGQPDRARLEASIDRVLDLELALMTESYHHAMESEVHGFQMARERELLRDRLAEAQEESRSLESRLLESERYAGIGRMASVVAHELKNPLAGIDGALSLLLRKVAPGDTEVRPILKEARAQIDRLNQFVQDLLVYSKPITARPMELRFADVTSSSRALLENDPALSEIEIVTRDELGESGRIWADPLLLRLSLQNLLLNAADAMEGRAGRIDLRGHLENGDAVISVEDTGPGIPPFRRDEIFDPFVTTKTRGTGLGLALVRRIMEAHEGSVEVAEGTEGGARFDLRFPAT